ncbi:PREDICTED: uncharacterized protein LOC109359709 [Lupinus angustifolius]|uniref:uncharacterized protein LOC109359709 n=1 Tax=Lupinus angustifolius TaxID=3871 RepID=UPI00092EF45E|nr:PREDICTED: uncharacterized protein LOC109359709 [Lupinus angustifolius]
MTGDKTKFIELSPKEKGHVTYGDNNQGKILGVGKIGNASQTINKNVLYVEGLEHNLLSISQLSDNGNKCIEHEYSTPRTSEQNRFGERMNEVLEELARTMLNASKVRKKAYRVFNKRTMIVEESIHVVYDESSPKDERKGMCDDLVGTLEDSYLKGQESEKGMQEEQITNQELERMPQAWKTKKDHPINNVIGVISKGVVT